MRIETSKGKTHDIRFIGPTLRDDRKIMIILEDDRTFKDIASDFEGLETITQPETPDIHHVYRGYTELVGVNLNDNDGTVRLTLKKGDAA